MALTPGQRAVLATIKQVAAQKRASPKQVKAAIETGIVESGLQNLPGGDADSAGWRQERASLYKDPTNLRASISRFFDETAAVKDKYGRAGDLAAAVQRPAAQYRGRYQQQSGRADQLLGSSGGGGGQGAASSQVRSTTTTTPGVDNSSGRAAAIAAFLGNKGADPLDFALQIKGLQDTPGSTTTKVSGSRSSSSPTAKAAGAVKIAAGAERPGVGLQKPVLSFLHQLAGASGREVDVTTGTNHNQMTTSGNVSDHWGGNAADLGVGGDARQNAAVGKKGDLIAAHAIQVASGKSFGEALAMARKGGVFNFETKQGRVQILWRTLTGGNHYNHVHVGVNPNR